MANTYSFKELPHSRQKLIITQIDEKLLQKAEKKVIEEFSKTLNLKGFRQGKIPKNIVMEHIDESFIRLQTIKEAIPNVANEILVEKKIRVVGEPNISIDNLDPLEIVLEYDVYPNAQIGDYKNISIKMDKKTATDKEVQEAMDHVIQRMTEYKKVDRNAKKGDRIEIDFEGKTPDGVPLENAVSKNHPVVIGSNMLVPGFEDELIGLKAGDEKTFEITFPEDYHSKKLAGKKVVFEIKVHQVEESDTPELNEEFIEKMTGKKRSLEDWKKEIKKQIQLEHDRDIKLRFEEKYYDKLIDLTDVELPKTLIDNEKKDILTELKQRILKQGLSYEHYLQANGNDEDKLLESFDKQARDRIKLRMALQKISDLEKIEVSDLDIEEGLNELLMAYSEDKRAPIKQQYQAGTPAYVALEYQITLKKTLEKIMPKE